MVLKTRASLSVSHHISCESGITSSSCRSSEGIGGGAVSDGGLGEECRFDGKLDGVIVVGALDGRVCDRMVMAIVSGNVVSESGDATGGVDAIPEDRFIFSHSASFVIVDIDSLGRNEVGVSEIEASASCEVRAVGVGVLCEFVRVGVLEHVVQLLD